MEEETFDIKTETKVLNLLKKVLQETQDRMDPNELYELPHATTMDPSNVLMVEAKTKRAKDILRRFIHNNDERKMPELEFIANGEVASRYPFHFLYVIFAIFEAIEVSPKIKMKKDYPMLISSEDFDFIIAPIAE